MRIYNPVILEKLAKAFWCTYRVREIGRTAAMDSLSAGGMILAWHCHLGTLAVNWGPMGYTTLAGLSREGEAISRTVERLGWTVIRGSSLEGGLGSLRIMARLLKLGTVVAMTPDGPNGPPRQSKLGPVMLQQLSGLPIIPIGVAAGWKYTFKDTWDLFEIPFPFSRVIIHYGPPVTGLSRMDRSEAAGVITRAIEDANNAARKALTS